MKAEILRILREAGEYVSGQELCHCLGVSRTAIWKWMKKLQEEGYVIEAVQNKGYRLVETPDYIQAEVVGSWLHSNWLGHVLYYQESVDSTNTWAKKLAEEGAPHGTVVLADEQTAGKGRRGRTWENPKGVNIAFTFLLRPRFLPEVAPMLTLVMGLSVAQVCREMGMDSWIKWPNDVVVSRKKVCGILTEMSTEIDYINYVVIGVGINVNQKVFDEELKEKATSLMIETGAPVKRSALIAAVMKHFEINYALFMENGDLSGLQESYNEMLVNRGKEVRILEPGNEYNAHAYGINETGELIVRTQKGEEKHVFAGEVSVRGIYGYV